MTAESMETITAIIKARGEDLESAESRLTSMDEIAWRKRAKRDKTRAGVRFRGDVTVEGWEGTLWCWLGGQGLGVGEWW